jgi:hypothetical protein
MEDNQISTPSQETPEIQPAAEEETPSTGPNRSKKWFIIGGALVVFLALAAFLGARLLKPKMQAGPGGGGGIYLSSKGGPGGGAKSVSIHMIPAKELPQTKSSTSGLFVRRQDQSIFIGTGRISMMISKSANGSSTPSGSYDGPVVEVVITHDTQVFQDITDMNPGNIADKGGTANVQQIVKPGLLEDIGANSMVEVWGDKQGDRYVASTITFR